MLKVYCIIACSWLVSAMSFAGGTQSHESSTDNPKLRPHLEKFLQTMIQYYADTELLIWQRQRGLEAVPQETREHISSFMFATLKQPAGEVFANCSDDELSEFQHLLTKPQMQEFLVTLEVFMSDMEKTRTQFEVSLFCLTKGPALPNDHLGDTWKNYIEDVLKTNKSGLDEKALNQTAYAAYEHLAINFIDEHKNFEETFGKFPSIHDPLSALLRDFVPKLKAELEECTGKQ